MLLDGLPKVLGAFYHSLPRKRVTKIGLISLGAIKTFPQKLLFKLLFERRVAHAMPCALQKIIMAEVSGHM